MPAKTKNCVIDTRNRKPEMPNKKLITGEKITIREKTLADARNDYKWCRDPELSRLDAAFPINMTLTQYIDEFTIELRYPSLSRRRFAVDTLDGEHIGNCSYYNIDVKRGEAEIGIMIGNPDYWSKGYGTDVIKSLVTYIFQHTSFSRLYLKTLDWNIRAQKCFTKSGFTPGNRLSRDGYNFLMMELSRKQWQTNTEQKERERNEQTQSSNR
jgi:RimJ/RimL family protein N-acetyltransferase